MGELNGKSVAGSKSGAARHRVRAELAPGVDPLFRVFATNGRVPVSVTVAAAVILHVGMAGGATAAAHFGELFAWHRGIRDVIAYRLSQYEMEIVKEPVPPP